MRCSKLDAHNMYTHLLNDSAAIVFIYNRNIWSAIIIEVIYGHGSQWSIYSNRISQFSPKPPFLFPNVSDLRLLDLPAANVQQCHWWAHLYKIQNNRAWRYLNDHLHWNFQQQWYGDQRRNEMCVALVEIVHVLSKILQSTTDCNRSKISWEEDWSTAYVDVLAKVEHIYLLK